MIIDMAAFKQPELIVEEKKENWILTRMSK